MSSWLIYQGEGTPHCGVERLPEAPPWRTFDADAQATPTADLGFSGWNDAEIRRARSYRMRGELLKPVNAALYLRRPLLVTGSPGVGKSSLAYAIAYELGLRPVLRWTITSRTTLLDGLYRYDSIGRLQDVTIRPRAAKSEIGRYIRLGPLGTALLPADTPRVLLIDEIDKADIDLPNDLLTVFEDGEYEITELARMADDEPSVEVNTADADRRETVVRGQVRCRQFPLVVITSNGERDFPPAFLRRCLRIDIGSPDLEQLRDIVAAHLGAATSPEANEIIEYFHQRSQEGSLATDQLLNAIQLTCQTTVGDGEREELLELLLRFLDSSADRS